jgi:hypothetical protein
MESIFSKFDEPSRKLMSYAEKLVTDKKGDPVHCNTVSFGNCMIRLSGSFNAKYIKLNDKGEVVDVSPQSEVKIVQRWDGYKPNIRWLLKDYWLYLIQQKNNDALSKLRKDQKKLRFEWKYPNRRPEDMKGKEKIYGWIDSIK